MMMMMMMMTMMNYTKHEKQDRIQKISLQRNGEAAIAKNAGRRSFLLRSTLKLATKIITLAVTTTITTSHHHHQ
jgi:hypothetical protein